MAQNQTDGDIYNPKFVCALFDEMSKTYDRVNTITSFGFNQRWRKKLVSELQIKQGDVVVDLMSGMGECWKHLLADPSATPEIIGVDFSREMVEKSRSKHSNELGPSLAVLHEDVLNNSLSHDVADFVISGFGLKTFDLEQTRMLASQVHRLLKPGGMFAFLEISVPSNRVLRAAYMFYLKHIIPVFGQLFLGNPDNYRMLGVYTSKFGSVKEVAPLFDEAGLETTCKRYFFGCATVIVGRKHCAPSS